MFHLQRRPLGIDAAGHTYSFRPRLPKAVLTDHNAPFRAFSILGVRLFKGTFIGCDFSGLGTAALVEAMREFGLSKDTYVKPFREPDCLAAGGVWRATVDQNFDNVAYGLLSLFEIATTEGWVRGEGMLPSVPLVSKFLLMRVPEMRGGCMSLHATLPEPHRALPRSVQWPFAWV